jgi:RNA polymerase sigma-70 factor (ECF subfamily)
MRRIGRGSQVMVRSGTSSCRDDQPLVGFEELAMPLFDSLYNFARWIARDSDDAEDLVQETYLKALRSFASFQPGTNFRAWIFQILRNTFLSSRTKFERRMTEALDSDEGEPELAVDTETPETILINRSDSQLLQRAIDDLPVYYRETLLLCEVEEMSYQEIAQILSIPIGTVMSRLARARKAVRESLGSTPGAPPSRHLSHQIETQEKGAVA